MLEEFSRHSKMHEKKMEHLHENQLGYSKGID